MDKILFSQLFLLFVFTAVLISAQFDFYMEGYLDGASKNLPTGNYIALNFSEASQIKIHEDGFTVRELEQ